MTQAVMLHGLVASLVMPGAKLTPVTCTTQVTPKPGSWSFRGGRPLIKQRRELRCRCSLIYKLPVFRMSGASARYSRTHVPVETSTPPDRDFWNGVGRWCRPTGRQCTGVVTQTYKGAPFQKWGGSRCARPEGTLAAERCIFPGKAGEDTYQILFGLLRKAKLCEAGGRGPLAPRSWLGLSCGKSVFFRAFRVRGSPRRRSPR